MSKHSTYDLSQGNQEQERAWNTATEAVRFRLKRLEDKRIAFDEQLKKEKEQAIFEYAEKLEEHGMPIDWILSYIIKRLAPQGYMSESTIRRILKKSKYRRIYWSISVSDRK
jgi:hypothetical protein